ncbi:uncharacterized protein EHS24_007714 [Apiotrichum porosum]|uniref:Secreted protein n=1 Tax=Apiotrichum porosum TaxID=105984 RepID=A0A427XV65_9TREE|nr:uncharacterized protein EHS24_007714 [Apiotrichum porosum]RSH82720.1 hypothetical protein EHS24_007714 [Apiotrichum porosum]
MSLAPLILALGVAAEVSTSAAHYEAQLALARVVMLRNTTEHLLDLPVAIAVARAVLLEAVELGDVPFPPAFFDGTAKYGAVVAKAALQQPRSLVPSLLLDLVEEGHTSPPGWGIPDHHHHIRPCLGDALAPHVLKRVEHCAEAGAFYLSRAADSEETLVADEVISADVSSVTHDRPPSPASTATLVDDGASWASSWSEGFDEIDLNDPFDHVLEQAMLGMLAAVPARRPDPPIEDKPRRRFFPGVKRAVGRLIKGFQRCKATSADPSRSRKLREAGVFSSPVIGPQALSRGVSPFTGFPHLPTSLTRQL